MPPRVSIIIPHLAGEELLCRCLGSLEKTTYPRWEVLLVDNASTDGSVETARARFPWLKVVRNQTNLGYAGGCNVGIRHSSADYVLLLNDDTEVEPTCLSTLVEVAESDTRIAACQPKIRSLVNRRRFDYSGAAGGMMDIFGYPFALGRIFEVVEEDSGQYDRIRDIVWASGTATLLRRSALEEVGLLDEDFFAHMEEIDLDWRLHLRGYRVVAVPGAIVYHQSGSTLRAQSPMKLFLNHRNNLVMILKNYSGPALTAVFPYRIALELLTLAHAIAGFDFHRAQAVVKALGTLLFHLGDICRKRRSAQALRVVSDSVILSQLYHGSVALKHFIGGLTAASQLKCL